MSHTKVLRLKIVVLKKKIVVLLANGFAKRKKKTIFGTNPEIPVLKKSFGIAISTVDVELTYKSYHDWFIESLDCVRHPSNPTSSVPPMLVLKKFLKCSPKTLLQSII